MSEIEKQFFKAFRIPPLCCKKYITNCVRYDCENCENFDNTFSTYPEITDRILLELICIYIGYERIYMGTFEIDHFRRFILSILMDLYKETININKKERLKHQVQALFKENI